MNLARLPPWYFTEVGRKSYFENQYKEAWVAVLRPEVFIFSGSDIDWEVHRVENPNYEALSATINGSAGFDNVVMNKGERLWLLALMAAG